MTYRGINIGRFVVVNCTSALDTGRYLLWFRGLMITLSVVALVIVLIGIVFNSLIITVIVKHLRHSIPHQMMLWIAINDNFRLLADLIDFQIHLLESFAERLPKRFVRFLAVAHAIDLIFETYGSNASKYLLTELTVLQYISIAKPLINVTPFTVNIVAFVITIGNLIICIPNYYLLHVQYCVEQGKFKLSATFNSIWWYRAYAESFIHPIVPMFVVFVLSYLMIKVIRRANKFRKKMNCELLSITKSILKLNLVFIICNIPHILYSTLMFFGYAPGFSFVIRNIIIYMADFSTCVNSSVNFLIYMATDERFKSAFRKLRRNSRWHKISNSSETGIFAI